MSTDLEALRPRLQEYIERKGLEVEREGATLRTHCPKHDDKKPSAIIYEEYLHCPVCAESLSVFDLAGELTGTSDFKEMLAEVRDVLGERDIDRTPSKNTTGKTSKAPSKMVPVTRDAARDHYLRSDMLEIAQRNGWGERIVGQWACINADDMVEGVEVRFEGGKKKKAVMLFYWNGSHLTVKGAPTLLFGRDTLKPDGPVMIVEGPKTQSSAQRIPGFSTVTWNGGASKVKHVDWTPIYGRDVYFFPDDDEPGMKAAKTFYAEYGSQVNDFHIVAPIEDCRAIKPEGADIVEALEIMEPEAIAAHIKNNHINLGAGEDVKKETPMKPPSNPQPLDSPAPFPFRVLGVADDGYAYFMDRHGRLYNMKLDALSKNKLMNLAPITYWQSYLGTNKIRQDDWDQVTDDVIQVAGAKDFDIDDLRGRGAWRYRNRVCFHDGETQFGDTITEYVYLRKKTIDIGIRETPADFETVKAMKDAAFALSFETPADCMRALAWSAIAPFSGSLQWRPQALLTGRSGSGKSSIEYYIVRPLAIPVRMNGGETSGAGYIQSRGRDSGAVTIEEVETDTDKKRRYRDELFSVMRQSTSDDTPLGFKGTADQKGVTYMTRDMIMFVAISPEVDSIADENRLSVINITRPDGTRPWNELKDALTRAFTEENCARVRASVWNNLSRIQALAERMAGVIQEQTKRDHRFAISESILMATYLTIWRGLETVSQEQAEEFVEGVYQHAETVEERDDAEEAVQMILDNRVKVFGDKVKEYSIAEALTIVATGEIIDGKETSAGGKSTLSPADVMEFKRALWLVGVGLDPDGNVAIATRHTEIMKMINRRMGYSKVLRRHKNCVDHSKAVHFGSKSQRCTVISGLLEGVGIPF